MKLFPRLRKSLLTSEVFLFFLLLTACGSQPTATSTLQFPPTSTAPPSTHVAITASSPTLTPALSPTPVPTIPTNTLVERGELPPGFSLTTYAEVFGPTSLAFGPDGRLYVASTNAVVYALADRDGDGRAEERVTFASGVEIPLGIAWVENALYISYKGNVRAVEDTNGDGVSDRKTQILTGLPADGLHQNDGLAPGPDGYLYLGMGSTCDACAEHNRLNGSVLRFKPDGSELSVFASGFRNPYDVAFNTAGDLFATDNGRDKLGDDLPLEELNFVGSGLNYGWPACWEGNAGSTCAEVARAAATFTAHSSADGLTFYNGQNFPAEYQDNAFVAIFGSYILPEIERGVARVRLTKVGETYVGESEPFLKLGTSGRPLDVTVGPDGGLYVGDYERGAIYRIVWGGP